MLLPTLAAGAEWFAKLGSSFARMASTYPRLTRVIVGVTTGLIAFKVVAIASAYAYTFLKGAVLSLVVAYRAFVAGLALARVGMVGMNGLALISAARLRLVTLAQTALNLAMRANPLGLIVLGLTACAGAAYALIRHWRPLHDFFHGLWTDIQAVTRISVDWMMAKVQSLMQPLQALGRVWNKLSGWVHSENLPAVSLGQTITAPSSKQTSVQITQLLPLREAANMPASNNHTVHLNAPITIYAQTATDAKTIASEVQKALQQHTRQLQSQQRAALYDKVN